MDIEQGTWLVVEQPRGKLIEFAVHAGITNGTLGETDIYWYYFDEYDRVYRKTVQYDNRSGDIWQILKTS